jgi:hypothetical protein
MAREGRGMIREVVLQLGALAAIATVMAIVCLA